MYEKLERERCVPALRERAVEVLLKTHVLEHMEWSLPGAADL